MPIGWKLATMVALCLLLGVGTAKAGNIQDINQLFRKGDLAGALAQADLFLQKNPRNAQARFLKGLILAEQGKPADAIDIFTGLTQDYPELPEPYNNLAVLYAAQGKYDDARRELEMAIRALPGYATAHENLGDLYAKMASIAYGQASQLDNANSTAKAKLALINEVLTIHGISSMGKSGEPNPTGKQGSAKP
jgi:Flp pilus assembly protein TadD